MQMTHVYQPVMIETLLKNGGTASAQQIAEEFLSRDLAQLEYYIEIVDRWPRRTLKHHGVIAESGRGSRNRVFELNAKGLTREQRGDLEAMCRRRLQGYIRKKKEKHEGVSGAPGPISGSTRYDVLAKSAGRCVACGVSSQERRIDVDHIIPRRRGGPDHISNLQPLCYKCNAQKRDRDDMDFLLQINRRAFGHKGCPLCARPKMGIENPLAGAVELDPPGSYAVVPKRHTPSYFDLRPPEIYMMHDMVEQLRGHLKKKDGRILEFRVSLETGTLKDGSCRFSADPAASREAGAPEDESRHCAVRVAPIYTRVKRSGR